MKMLAFFMVIFLGWVNLNFLPKPEVFYTNNGSVTMLMSLNMGKTIATTNSANSVYEPATDKVDFVVDLKTFQFSNILIEYQFKETYLEVSKYPNVTFKGRMRSKVDMQSKAIQKVWIDGFLDMHGVIQKRTILAEVKCLDNQIYVKSDFTIRPAEHKIAIPAAFFTEEKDIIDIHFEGHYSKK
ncbi:MAG: YceI family protein [Microscillaceae bacterium]|nr:YceI family protein [Microscillaceae bacterium]MDW8459728.1 YceI family protein [Cytophagales bacterium]